MDTETKSIILIVAFEVIFIIIPLIIVYSFDQDNFFRRRKRKRSKIGENTARNYRNQRG